MLVPDEREIMPHAEIIEREDAEAVGSQLPGGSHLIEECYAAVALDEAYDGVHGLDFDAGGKIDRRQPGGRKGVLEDPAGAGAGLAQDERLAREVAQGVWRRMELMPGAADGDEILGAEGERVVVAVGEITFDEGEADRALLQHDFELMRVRHIDVDVHGRVRMDELRERVVYRILAYRHGHADIETLALGCLSQLLAQTLLVIRHDLHRATEDFPRWRQHQRLARLLEQRDAVLALEAVDVLRDAGLGDVERLGGTREIHVLTYGQERVYSII